MGVQLVQYNFAKHGSTTNIKLNPNSTSKRKIITKKKCIIIVMTQPRILDLEPSLAC